MFRGATDRSVRKKVRDNHYKLPPGAGKPDIIDPTLYATLHGIQPPEASGTQ